MSDKPWEQVIDALYGLGGYGELPGDETANGADPSVDLSRLIELNTETIDNAALALQERGLADVSRKVDGNGSIVKLETEGFRLGHDRDEAKRSRAGNRAVLLLTVVLAMVGMAQAFALTARVSEYVSGEMAAVAAYGALVLFFVVYIGLLRKG